jgi:ABC-type Fe3+-hydroxamate transport system substrate-binding protein
VRQVAESPAFRSSRAVRTNRVHALPARDLTSESPDSVSGVELLARLLHPEAFSS